MGKKLLIVESPAKAKTIGKYLGSEFVVKSSVGHIRDLPKENGAISIKPLGEGKWSFAAKYEIPAEKKKVVAELKDAASKADEIYLASDPDREGEAIAWHLKEVLSPVAKGKAFRRVTYNEITKSAVLKAVAAPREVNMPCVDAQQARRILDRLVGYKVSPLLWKYVQCANNRTLSAGRVQSVALRLLVERQREIDAFKPETYYILGAEAKKKDSGEKFTVKLSKVDGAKPDIRDVRDADALIVDLEGACLEVVSLKSQPRTRRPYAPFTTSTLQQSASGALGFSPGKTMKLAQALYEHGFITYMRTDSVNVSAEARAAAKEYIVSNFGDAYYPAAPHVYKSKATAQGAHEAIRPTDVARVPSSVSLDGPAMKLYDLIWRRFVASQMAEAKTTLRTAVFEARKQGLVHVCDFTASSTDIDFDGFLKVSGQTAKKKKADDDDDSDEIASLPPLSEAETLDVVRWLSDEKQTKGPKAYSEASLVKALEDNGVGRPSTYAATIETLKAREYAKTEKTRMTPLERGFLVCDWLVSKLDSLFNVGYTAEMEAELDKIEERGETMDSMLSGFYAKFTAALAACAQPPPAMEKFDIVFSLLDRVKEWKAPKKIGRRVYDDAAFVKSVKDQAASGRPLSARQLEFLVKMVASYSAQIPDAEEVLKMHGLMAQGVDTRTNAALAQKCFDALGRCDLLKVNDFIRSIHEQFTKGASLSPKQFSVLAGVVLERCQSLPDYEEYTKLLSGYAPRPVADNEYDETMPELFSLFDGIDEWKAPAAKSKKKLDDSKFVKSLKDYFARHNGLTKRQFKALRRLAVAYRDKIPGFDEKAARLGLSGKSEN
ncbi:MAG: type I DNA topoisomerase [Kiritimatiellae bacterium]|nr:type I DNA topoisomerase [Kiritimatiellia bacterium]